MEGIRVAQRCIKNLNYNAENSIMEIHIGDRVAEIELVSKEDNKVVLTIDGKPFEADVVMAENGTCNILMDGRSANAQLIRRENGKSYKVNTHYSSFNVEIVDSQAKYLRMRKKGVRTKRQYHFPNAGQSSKNPRNSRSGNESWRYGYRYRSHEDAEQLQGNFRLPHQRNTGPGRR